MGSNEKETSSSTLKKVPDLLKEKSDYPLDLAILGIEGKTKNRGIQVMPFFEIHQDVVVQNKQKKKHRYKTNLYKTILRQIETVNHPALFIQLAKDAVSTDLLEGKTQTVLVVPDPYVVQKLEKGDEVFKQMLKEGGMPVGWKYPLFISPYHLRSRTQMDYIDLTSEYIESPPSITAYVHTEYLLFSELDRDEIFLPIASNNEEPVLKQRIAEPVFSEQAHHYLPQMVDKV